MKHEKRSFREFIFGKKEEKYTEAKINAQPMQGLNRYALTTHAENESFYENDIVQSCITAHSNIVKKAKFELKNINDNNLAKILKKPNIFYTLTEFLEKIVIHLLINKNVFIHVKRNKFNYDIESLNIIDYTSAEVYENKELDIDKEDRIFIKFRTSDGDEELVNYKDIIHIKKSGYKDDIFSKRGISKPLYNVINVLNHLDNDIIKSVEGKGLKDIIIKTSRSVMEDDALKKLQDFVKYCTYQHGGSTIYLANGEGDEVTIQDKKETINTLKPDENPAVARIYNFFNVDADITSNKMTKERMHYFIQTNIEPLLITIEQAFTYNLLTETQIQSGAEITLNLINNRLDTLETSEKIKAIKDIADLGVLTKNEIRKNLGLEELKEGGDILPGSLNYMDANKITEYKLLTKDKHKNNVNNVNNKDEKGENK